MKKNIITDIIIFLLAVLFAYAAVSKLLEYETFKAQIGRSPLLTNHESWIAWLIPGIEIVISIGLFIPKTRLSCLYGSFTLMTLFTLYIAFILTFSPYVPCSCGGILSKMGWTEHLIFNTIFTIMAAAGAIIHSPQKEDSLAFV